MDGDEDGDAAGARTRPNKLVKYEEQDTVGGGKVTITRGDITIRGRQSGGFLDWMNDLPGPKGGSRIHYGDVRFLDS